MTAKKKYKKQIKKYRRLLEKYDAVLFGVAPPGCDYNRSVIIDQVSLSVFSRHAKYISGSFVKQFDGAGPLSPENAAKSLSVQVSHICERLDFLCEYRNEMLKGECEEVHSS